jgi:hypothetical protein
MTAILLAPGRGQDHRELGLLFRWSRRRRRRASRRRRHRGRRGHAQTLFQQLDQLGQVQHRHLLDCGDDFFHFLRCFCHFHYSLVFYLH